MKHIARFTSIANNLSLWSGIIEEEDIPLTGKLGEQEVWQDQARKKVRVLDFWLIKRYARHKAIR